MYSNTNRLQLAEKTLRQTVDLLEPILCMKSSVDGKMINKVDLDEINENLYSIRSQLSATQAVAEEEVEEREIQKILDDRKKMQ